MEAITLNGVQKRYKTINALDGLDLQVQQGELIGLVGVNGAGKTTTLSILMGFIRASGGTVNVLGQDPWREAASLHRNIAWLPGDVRLPDNLSGRDWLQYQGRMLGLETTRITALASDWEVPLERPMRTLSKGNRQKVALLRLLASPAELLILDEPTSGLDPMAQERLLLALRYRVKAGVTVLFSSHSLNEVQNLCDRIVVIDRGRVVRQGSLETLIGTAQRLSVWTRTPMDQAVLASWQVDWHTSSHCVVSGTNLLEQALPRLFGFGIERLEYGGMGLEHLLEKVKAQPEKQP
jgi:ABC-2 type transport system ATP-binding protein